MDSNIYDSSFHKGAFRAGVIQGVQKHVLIPLKLTLKAPLRKLESIKCRIIKQKDHKASPVKVLCVPKSIMWGLWTFWNLKLTNFWHVSGHTTWRVVWVLQIPCEWVVDDFRHWNFSFWTKDIRVMALKGTYKYYVITIWAFLDPLPPSVINSYHLAYPNERFDL